jgi:hypothetical protein
MSYTYLLEQGGASWEECSSDTPQFALWNLNLTAEKSYSKDNETASCQSSQSGMMSPPSTELRGEEKSMSSAEDSLAKTSQQQAREPESQEKKVDCGEKWPESLAKYDQDSRSWRTHQCLLFEDLTESLEIFPRWGMMHDGELWEPAMSAHFIEEIEFGSLPTEKEQLYPTPTCADAKNVGRNNSSQNNLHKITDLHLNPDFVEELMLWPTGWTDLKPLEMGKFQLWQQQHSEF